MARENPPLPRILYRNCDMVKFTSLCGLGQSAPNPVMSTLRYFRGEYEALLQQGPSSNGQTAGRMPLPLR